MEYPGPQVFADPLFCVEGVRRGGSEEPGRGGAPNVQPVPGSSPNVQASLTMDYTLDDNSPCVPENSPCGELIGARGVGCQTYPGGACCLPDGHCLFMLETLCEAASGSYQGSEVPCHPHPCPPGACCLPDGTCQVADSPDACDVAGGWAKGWVWLTAAVCF